MKRDCLQASKDGVGVQPSQRQLIARRENRERSGVALPRGGDLGKRSSKLQRRMYDLTSLNRRRQISPGNEVELVVRVNLEMRHISMIGRTDMAAPPFHGRSALAYGSDSPA